MLIRYTAALFNNAVFSKTVWASRVCLCLIRLGRGSIVDGEDSAAKLKYSDESPQCWSTYPLCWPWWSYSRGKRYPTSADTITFLKAEKQPVRSSVRCYCVTWWFLLAGNHTDTKWRCLITLELLCSLGKKNALIQAWRVSPLHWSHTSIIPWLANIYCMVIQL